MKKYLILSLVVVSALTLSGCGTKNTSRTASNMTGNLQKIIGNGITLGGKNIKTTQKTQNTETTISSKDMLAAAIADKKKDSIVITPEKEKVDIIKSGFNAALVTIKTGGTVTWINGDNIKHTVTSSDKSFSGVLAPGATYSHTFDKQGVYIYSCSLHPTMQGVVIVSDK